MIFTLSSFVQTRGRFNHHEQVFSFYMKLNLVFAEITLFEEKQLDEIVILTICHLTERQLIMVFILNRSRG